MVKVSEVLVFSAIGLVPKALARDGGVVTVKVAVLEATPEPPLVEVGALVVLLYVPGVADVTLTLIKQFVFTPTVPPVRVMLPEPAVAVSVPPQAFVAPLGVATTSPEGSESVTASPVRATVLAAGLVIVRVRVEVPPAPMLLGAKALATVGGISTDRVAVAAAAVVVLEVSVLVVLFLTPEVVAVTFTLMLQLPKKAPTEPPERLTLPVPAVAVNVPPQPLLTPLGVATTSPAGRVSVKAMFVTPPILLFWMLKVSVEVPPTGMLVGLNDLVKVGAAAIAAGAVKALASNRMAAASSRFMVSTLPVGGGG